nr:ElyC/SanA/YdcF family protein [Pseudomonas sp. TH31]
MWERTEADIFAQRAMALGVSADQFTLESRATNFAENIAFARALFPYVRRATFLTKPNSIRRVALTLPVQWPGIEACVDAPSFSFPGEVSNLIGVLGLIDEMVGDVHRIMVYPSLGFQAEQVIPEDVQLAWRYLVEQGFDHHLIKGRS